MNSDPSPIVELETINYSGHLVAEIYWLAKMANCKCNYSLCSVDHVSDIFHKIFLGIKSVASFSLIRTSASYIISEGLASYFKKTIVEGLVKSDLPLSNTILRDLGCLNPTKREWKTTVIQNI